METQIESVCKIIGRTALLVTALVIAIATGGCDATLVKALSPTRSLRLRTSLTRS